MHKVYRTLLSALIGAVVCAVLGFLSYFILTTTNGTQFEEAYFYSLLVAVLSAFMGAIIGFVVGIMDLGVIGGGLAGLLFTVVVVAFYIFSSGRPGSYGYFGGESAVFFEVLTLPAVLTGVITAVLKKRFLL